MIEVKQRPICDSAKGGLGYPAKVPVILRGHLMLRSYSYVLDAALYKIDNCISQEIFTAT